MTSQPNPPPGNPSGGLKSFSLSDIEYLESFDCECVGRSPDEMVDDSETCCRCVALQIFKSLTADLGKMTQERDVMLNLHSSAHATIDHMTTTVTRLRGALIAYGDHKDECPTKMWTGKDFDVHPRPDCNCGWGKIFFDEAHADAALDPGTPDEATPCPNCDRLSFALQFYGKHKKECSGETATCSCGVVAASLSGISIDEMKTRAAALRVPDDAPDVWVCEGCGAAISEPLGHDQVHYHMVDSHDDDGPRKYKCGPVVRRTGNAEGKNDG